MKTLNNKREKEAVTCASYPISDKDEQKVAKE